MSILLFEPMLQQYGRRVRGRGEANFIDFLSFPSVEIRLDFALAYDQGLAASAPCKNGVEDARSV